MKRSKFDRGASAGDPSGEGEASRQVASWDISGETSAVQRSVSAAAIDDGIKRRRLQAAVRRPPRMLALC